VRTPADAVRIRQLMEALARAADPELASPLDFIPVLPGWEDRSPLVARNPTLVTSR